MFLFGLFQELETKKVFVSSTYLPKHGRVIMAKLSRMNFYIRKLMAESYEGVAAMPLLRKLL